MADAGIATEGTEFLLLTDGMQSWRPRISDVLPDIEAKGIKVHAFLYTEYADPTIISLAKVTGGLVFFDSGSSNSTALLNGFLATAVHQPGSSSLPSQVSEGA